MDERPLVVAVTGAAGYIGRRLLRDLEGEPRIERVVALDRRQLPIPYNGVVQERVDVSAPLEEIFRRHGVTAVVHLAFHMTPGRNGGEARRIREANLNGTRSVLAACASSYVSSFVYLSSHTVYGAHKDNPNPITEEAPLRPTRAFQYGWDKALCEEIIREYASAEPSFAVSILRCCVVLGASPDNSVARAFARPLLLRVAGHDPQLQFVHEDDLARLLHLLTIHPVRGTFNVAGEGVIRYSRMAQLCGSRLVPLPSALAYPIVGLSWRMGLQKDAPSIGLDFIRHPLVLGTGRLKRETGFYPSYTAEESLTSYLAASSG